MSPLLGGFFVCEDNGGVRDHLGAKPSLPQIEHAALFSLAEV